MFENADRKLSTISTIWQEYIWNYNFCRRKINFKEDQNSNYFGDIMSYFSDTFRVLEKKSRSDEFTDVFDSTISFLQAIYIQQDFIEEYHFIFGTGIDKGKLKLDDNYFINRDIRNEIIGHPIRKTKVPKDHEQAEYCECCKQKMPGRKQEEVLLSSTLFSNETNSSEIAYLKYHRSNNYKFSEEKHLRIDILNRHQEFLNHHFDIIIKKLKTILKRYQKELIQIRSNKDNFSLEDLCSIIEHKFEYFMLSDPLFNQKYLIELLAKEKEHYRYKFALENFYVNLNTSLNEVINNISDLIQDKDYHNVQKTNTTSLPEIEYVDDFIDLSITEPIHEDVKVSYIYELGKLASPERDHFNFFVNLLESRCEENLIVINEIRHLKNNRYNKFEYYSAYTYLWKLLDKGK